MINFSIDKILDHPSVNESFYNPELKAMFKEILQDIFANSSMRISANDIIEDLPFIQGYLKYVKLLNEFLWVKCEKVNCKDNKVNTDLKKIVWPMIQNVLNDRNYTKALIKEFDIIFDENKEAGVENVLNIVKAVVETVKNNVNDQRLSQYN